MAGRSKNLLRNACGKNGLDYWEVVCSGGDGFKCEETPAGCKAICECTTVKKNLPCWSTSHEQCEKLQLANLLESGTSGDKLDEKKPAITVRDWYAPRHDCGCTYNISVRLLGGDKTTELDKWEFTDTKDEGADWTKARHVFSDYPSGVRYVEFRHGGQDNKNWAGHFGVKMTNSGVFVGKKRKTAQKTSVKDASGKNLLKNSSGQSNLEGWEVTSSGGDGFKTEDEADGSKPVKEGVAHAEESSCWATSHGDCEKKQLIDLGFEGFDPAFMDEVRPEIKISEWVASRSDAGCNYWLSVRLLNGDLEEVDKREVKEAKDASGEWFEVKDSFTAYGSGVRFIEYKHGGRDNCGWAGHFGAKMTCSSVRICTEAKAKTKSSSSSSSSSSSDEAS